MNLHSEGMEVIIERRKNNAEAAKRHRERMKLKRGSAELDSLLSLKGDPLPTVSKKNKKKTDHLKIVTDTNCKQLTVNKKKNQSSMNHEARIVISEDPYEDRDVCANPNAIMSQETDIPPDGNCLFSSLLRLLQVQIPTSVLRQRLLDSPLLNSCQNPISARKILISDSEYGDLDCLFIFSKTYNINICVHLHYFNSNMQRELVRFCHFKVNDSCFFHLHLRNTHFTPYVVLEENDQKNDVFPSNKSSDEIHVEEKLTTQIKNKGSSATNQNYTNYYKHSHAHLEFYHRFKNNTYGHTCAVCDRLWWKNELKAASNVDENLLQTIIPNYEPGSSIDVCFTCKSSLDKKRIPLMSISNGFKYPTLPPHLPTLNLIEQRLISPKIPFMQIRKLRHVDGQDGIHAQIINVPIEIDTMVKTLPRNIEDDHCFYVDLRKRTIHKTSYYHGLINENNIKEWLEYLAQTPLYIQHRIEIGETILNRERDDPLLKLDDVSEQVPIEENLTALQQTLLWNEDKILQRTPGEQSSPLSIIFDEEDAEELSFPTIYGGEFRNFREEITVTPFMKANSELRRTDRRGAEPQHLLYLAAKIMRVRVSNRVTVASKHFGHKTSVSKEKIKSLSYINHCLETNLAFLRCIPNSTWYWADRKKDLFAVIRQLGKPTAYMTVRANETDWLDLVKLLYKLKYGVDVSDDFISRMNYIDKAKLVNEDSVTCAIYFNRLLNCLLKILQYKKKSPFGKYRVIHYFRRIEFQDRGSPNAHILFWLENSPKNILNNDKDAIKMIDELVFVSEAEASGNIHLQTYEQTSNGYKRMDLNKKDNCRFGSPFMPSRHTITLLPMEDSDYNFSKYKTHYKSIRKKMETIEYTDFDIFYTDNNIDSDDHYYNIIRAGIKNPILLYRRQPSEKWHNSFNPFLLHHLKSNMNFQIIQDENACAAYVYEYLNKHNRGISDLQRQIIQIMDENPEFEIADITKKMSIDLLQFVEMSAQEAAWFLLREPIDKSSTATIYIPTIHPSERLSIRKSLKDVNEPDDEYTEDWKENWFDKYEKRPQELDNVTLAQFVAKYFVNKKGVYTERDIPKIIRYRKYDIAENFDDYRREMVLLHISFRSEDNDILADDKFIEIYEENKDLIVERRKEFELNLDSQTALDICEQLCRDNDQSEDDKLEMRANQIFENDLLEFC